MGFGVFGPRSKSWLHQEFSASHFISLSLSFLTCKRRIINLSYRRSVNTSIIKASTVLCPPWRWDRALFILRAWDWGMGLGLDWFQKGEKGKPAFLWKTEQNKSKNTNTTTEVCVAFVGGGQGAFPSSNISCWPGFDLSSEDHPQYRGLCYLLLHQLDRAHGKGRSMQCLWLWWWKKDLGWTGPSLTLYLVAMLCLLVSLPHTHAHEFTWVGFLLWVPHIEMSSWETTCSGVRTLSVTNFLSQPQKGVMRVPASQGCCDE